MEKSKSPKYCFKLY